MKKMLITGHRGLLGSACVRHFRQAYDICISVGDLRDPQCARYQIRNHKPDIIINCAAKVGGVKANRDNPVEFMLDNIRIQANMMESSHDYGVETFVHIATSCMFPKDAALPVQESSLFTGKFEDSVESYALAKIAGWRLAKAYFEQYKDRFLTVAPSNIYGPGDSYNSDAHVIPSLMRKYAKAVRDETPFEVWGIGDAIREFIYADDVASAIEAVTNKWDSPEIVSIGTGVGTSIRDLVLTMIETAPLELKPAPGIVWNASQPTGIPRKVFDVSKIKSLGWEPKTTLEDGLRLTWQDFLKGKPRGM